ncbi:MAG: bifunctional folylpolyglutamate synthase/dihydrofolate synthase [Caldisericaceae bacterium]
MYYYKDALDYIYRLGGKQGIPAKYDLNKIENLLRIIGNPQDKQNFVHITGTKGKGSTTNYLASVLKSTKYKVGMYISPSLINTSERISINGELIAPKEFLSYTNFLKEIYDSLPEQDVPSTFETFTIIAFLYFQKHLTDLNILEVGLGGRLDATNVIKDPLVSIITEISFDHQKILGDTLEKIAFEKAGIIKDYHPVVIGSEVPSAYETIIRVAKERKSKYFLLGKDFYPSNVVLSEEGSIFDFISPSLGCKIRNVQLRIAGLHQVRNASVAIQASMILKSLGYDISEDSIKVGLNNAFWPARFEIIKKHPTVILDGAHNGSSAKALVETLKLFRKNVVFLFSMLQDKNIETVLGVLSPVASRFVITEVPYSYGRRSDAASLDLYLRKFIEPSRIYIEKNPRVAYEKAVRMLSSDELLCVTGSLYLTGFVREFEKIFTFSSDLL